MTFTHSLFILVFLKVSSIVAGEILTTNDFGIIEEEICKLDEHSLVLFDVDDTLISANDAILKPKGKTLFEQLITNCGCRDLFREIRLQAPHTLVDNRSLRLVQKLQQNKIPIIALTAAPSKVWESDDLGVWRVKELQKYGFDFSSAFPYVDFFTLPKDAHQKHLPLFKSGVLYSSFHPKGDILVAFLQQLNLKPKKVIFVDDGIKHVESVVTSLDEQGIPCLGIVYTAAEEAPCDLHEERALFQINYFVQHNVWLGDEKSQELLNSKVEVPLFYWDARPRMGFSNFGDAMSVSIVEKILGRPITTITKPVAGQKKFLAIGSIVNYAGDGDVLWGTGVNGKYQKRSDYPFQTLDVRAVRGPLSRQFLMDMGVNCPEVYGDPTLLLPKLFPEFKKSSSPSHDYIVIPHFSDEDVFRHLPNMVSVKEDWRTVVAKILDSKFVISSALSGVIVAEAFGIPARLIISPNENNTETIFKYSDYYYGTNRPHYRFATSVEEALDMGGETMPECDLEQLLRAFPHDLFYR